MSVLQPIAPIFLAAAPLYCDSLSAYSRRQTCDVQIGDLPLGSAWPIRVQSMTTADTMDTAATLAECIRMAEAGCEYIRITAPSVKEAENLGVIRTKLHAAGFRTPLIADIHFTPNAAELAARLVEKVRINPGNYADKKRFETIEYSESGYQAELERIRLRFEPLVRICKEYGTAMRIGTNHGSLSDRILSRYGDTPLGMVESALEFLRICQDMSYHNVVLSMKASNTQVMVQAYRLLVAKLKEENMKPYPLHLGVTEAGDGEDGRIKSAVGIGALLEDGLGDTIRVSLTEAPELEIPVARALAVRYNGRANHAPIAPMPTPYPINPYSYNRRLSSAVANIGGGQVPCVIADYSQKKGIEPASLFGVGYRYSVPLDKWNIDFQACDYVFLGDNQINFPIPGTLSLISNYSNWIDKSDQPRHYPLLELGQYVGLEPNLRHSQLNFVSLDAGNLVSDTLIQILEKDKTVVLMLHSHNAHAMADLRRFFVELMRHNIAAPVVICRKYQTTDTDTLMLEAATDAGGLLIEGLGDGVFLQANAPLATLNRLGFGILQAARTRMSKTEYISCPSCGRTLFDLQETTNMIRSRTDHLKGLKIGIMGCIVNGPGEMADADYGYVGVGKDKIALYRGQNVVKKAVPASDAVDELIAIIQEDGRWQAPELD